MSEAFKDESDALKTCDSGSSLYVERFPSLFLSTPETFLTLLSFLTRSWSAGRKFLSSWGDGAEEPDQRQPQMEGLCLLLSSVCPSRKE